MIFGQFKAMMKEPGEEQKEPETTQKPPEAEKSSSSEEFLRTPEAQKFVSDWMAKTKDWDNPYTRRGLNDLLSTLHQVPGLDSNKKVLKAAEAILLKLGGMDGLRGFLAGWKAKSEGLIKGLKTALGGG
jgi:hypothetical protein